jgi:hypothetical protein
MPDIEYPSRLPKCRFYLLSLLLISICSSTLAARTTHAAKVKAKSAPYVNLTFQLGISSDYGKSRSDRSDLQLVWGPEISEKYTRDNQIYEIGQYPRATIETINSGFLASGNVPATTQVQKDHIITNATRLTYVLQLRNPSGKILIRFIANHRVADGSESWVEPLPGGNVEAVGDYLLTMIVKLSPKAKPLLTLHKRFMVVPKQFIAIRTLSIQKSKQSYPASIVCQLYTSSVTPVHVDNINTKLVLFGKFKETDDRFFGWINAGSIPGLPSSLTLATKPQKYTLNLEGSSWMPRFYTGRTPLRKEPFHELFNSSNTYLAFGEISGTYKGLDWYRSWTIGEMQNK